MNHADLKRIPDDAFREEKSCGQLSVVARRSHRDREASASEADFESFLHGQDVVALKCIRPAHSADRHGNDGAAHNPFPTASKRSSATASACWLFALRILRKSAHRPGAWWDFFLSTPSMTI